MASSENSGTEPSSQQDRLQALPPEIRNRIFQYVLVGGEVEVGPFPGITGTNKQFRAETLPVWLVQNTFTAHVHDVDIRALNRWLLRLSSIPSSIKKCMRPVVITALNPLRLAGHGFHFFEFFNAWYPTVVAAKTSGLRPDQLVWPLLPDAKLTEDTRGGEFLLKWVFLGPLLEECDMWHPHETEVSYGGLDRTPNWLQQQTEVSRIQWTLFDELSEMSIWECFRLWKEAEPSRRRAWADHHLKRWTRRKERSKDIRRAKRLAQGEAVHNAEEARPARQ